MSYSLNDVFMVDSTLCYIGHINGRLAWLFPFNDKDSSIDKHILKGLCIARIDMTKPLPSNIVPELLTAPQCGAV